MTLNTVQDMLDLARSEPDAALSEIPKFLERSDLSETDRAVALRAAGLAARLGGDLTLSTAYLNRSLAVATAADDEVRIIEAHLSIAGNRFLGGDSTGAAALLEELAPSDPVLLARVRYQAGTVLARTGQTAPAMAAYNEALDAVQDVGDRRMTAAVLKNRSMLRILTGDFVGASEDIEAARDGFAALGLKIEIAYCTHNTGLIAYHSGDLPTAFARFTEAEEQIRDLAHSEWEVQAGHCQALIAAGLAREAAEMANRALLQLDTGHLLVDRAEALLVKAEAEAALGVPEAAKSAQLAAETFASQNRSGFTDIAAILAHQIDPDAAAATDLRRRSEALDRAGMRAAGLNGWLVTADIEAIEDADAALATLESVSRRVRRADLQTRIAYDAARIDALLKAGRQRSAVGVARAAARRLEDHQSLIGLSDIRLGFRSYANRILAAGLQLAIKSNRNARVFDWIERNAISRSLVRRAEPVADPELRAALTQLSTLKSNQDRTSRRRRVELEARVRVLARTKAPPVAPQRQDHVSVAEALGNRVLISFALAGSDVIALRLRKGILRRIVIGPQTEINPLIGWLRAALVRSATDPSQQNLQESVRLLAAADAVLLGPIHLDHDPAIFVATSSLADVPWSGLPSRRGASTVVARSAAGWLACDRTSWPTAERVLVITGPDLDYAESEAAAVAAVGNDVEIADRSSIETLVGQVEDSEVVHVACHGDLRSDNPLFSSLRLHAGNVFAYQMQQLTHPPATVVLSACHLGLTRGSPGELLLGFTDALLSAGTSSVIASTLPVPDTEVTAHLVADLHRRMADGERPATALASSQSALSDDVAPLYAAAFTCFGAG